MDREEKKRYLNQYRELKLKINALAKDYEFWEDKSRSIPISKIDKAGVHGGLIKKDPITKHLDICILISQKQEEAQEKLKELLELIESVPDPRQRSILTLRYVNGMYFHQIAREIGYSIQHVWRLHDSALDELEIEESEKHERL